MPECAASITLARGKGFSSFSAVESDALVRTYFRRRDAPAARAD